MTEEAKQTDQFGKAGSSLSSITANQSLSSLRTERETARDYGRYCRPRLIELLQAARLDAVYEGAQGTRLWQRRGGQESEVLDLVGGFGAGLFGHNHPDLVAEAKRLLDTNVPAQVQGSCRRGAAILARDLNDRLGGDFVTIFTNSGTETVEAALKHAYLERRRPVVWAVQGAFHGKTGCAIQMTWSYREPFSAWGPEVRFLNPDVPSSWNRAKEEGDDRVAAAFIEPILGEGGVKPIPADFIEWLSTACRELDIPVIADEIQTGMGRTGTFLASQQMNLVPDYICLSKALGGGLAKIGALLIKRSRFVPEFATIHTSTFAEDDYSCFIALRALRLLDDDDLPARCAVVGARLLADLKAVQSRFPQQIREVRGRGLMIGIELARQDDSPSNILRILSQHEKLGWIAAAYLLNVHNIRLLPTLGSPWTLRVQPSAYVSQSDLDYFLKAFEMMCEALVKGDVAHLTSFQVNLPAPSITDYRSHSALNREEPRTPSKVAFIGHLICPQHLPLLDPSLGALPSLKARQYLERMSKLGGPTLLDRVHVRSRTGDEVHLTFIGLSLSAQQILDQRRKMGLAWVREQIEAAVSLARDEGCQVVGLGGYASSVTANCLLVRTPGIALTSGNSLTVATALMALRDAVWGMAIDPVSVHLGVVGVPGNIASICALLLAPQVAGLTLVTRNPESPRLQALVDRVRAIAPNTAINITCSLDDLRPCSMIITATVSGGGLIRPEHLGTHQLALCDISVPPDVSPSVAHHRPEALVFAGGVLRLPCDDRFSIAGLPLEPGHVLACMAETLIMGLEGMTSHGSTGEVTVEGVEQTLSLAMKHGFTLGRFKNNHFY